MFFLTSWCENHSCIVLNKRSWSWACNTEGIYRKWQEISLLKSWLEDYHCKTIAKLLPKVTFTETWEVISVIEKYVSWKKKNENLCVVHYVNCKHLQWTFLNVSKMGVFLTEKEFRTAYESNYYSLIDYSEKGWKIVGNKGCPQILYMSILFHAVKEILILMFSAVM